MEISEALVQAYYRGYTDRKKEQDYDPGHALDLLDRLEIENGEDARQI